MTQQTPSPPSHAPISRRTLIKAAAVAATAIIGAAAAPGVNLAAAPNNLAGTLNGPTAAPQAGVTILQAATQNAPPNQGTPPSVVSDPPRQWGPDAPPTIYPDPDIIVVDPSFGPVPARHHRDPPPVDRRALGGGAGLVEPGPLPALQRRPGQHPVPLYLGRRAGDQVPRPVVQQQRQRLRLPGPPVSPQDFNSAASCAGSTTAR